MGFLGVEVLEICIISAFVGLKDLWPMLYLILKSLLLCLMDVLC